MAVGRESRKIPRYHPIAVGIFLMEKLIKPDSPYGQFIDRIKKQSPLYPCIYSSRKGSELYLSSIVRIFRDGIWYRVHVVESGQPIQYALILQRLHISAYKVVHLYQLCGLEELDEDQKSEEERIKKWQ